MSKSRTISEDATKIRDKLIPLIYTKDLTETEKVLNVEINKLSSPDDKIYVLEQLMIRSLVIKSNFTDILKANLSAVIVTKPGITAINAKTESERVITEINKKVQNQRTREAVLTEAAKELVARASPVTIATKAEPSPSKAPAQASTTKERSESSENETSFKQIIRHC